MLLGQCWGPRKLNVYRPRLQHAQVGAQGLHGPLTRKAVAHAACVLGTARLETDRCHDVMIYVYVNVNYGSFLHFHLEQQRTCFFLMLLHLFQISPQVGHLLFQLLAVQH